MRPWMPLEVLLKPRASEDTGAWRRGCQEICVNKGGVMSALYDLFCDPGRFMVRGHCGAWNEGVRLLYLHSNILLIISYMLIGIAFALRPRLYAVVIHDITLRRVFALVFICCAGGAS